MSVNYDLLPDHCREGMRLWIENGIPPGGFLQAVLRNDFCGAIVRADSINEHHLRAYAQFLHYEAPPDCWGSEQKVIAWKERWGRK